VGLAVVDRHAHVLQRIAGDGAFVQHLAHALLDGRDELVRDAAADGLVDELEARALLARLDAQPDLAELAGAAGLLLVPVVALGLGGDGLAVGDARRVGLDVDVELLGEPAHQHLEVQLAEAAHDGLVGGGVVLDVEAGVFGLELVQRVGELLLVAALGDVDGEPEQRHRALDAGEVEVVLVVGVVQHGVEVDVVDARHGEDVAGHALVDLDQLGAVHAEQVVDLERLARIADEQLVFGVMRP
jgi:hypothetical protein